MSERNRRGPSAPGVDASWSDRRRNARLVVDLDGDVRGSGHRGRGVRVLDVSVIGCRIVGGAFRVGDRVYVRVWRIGPLLATVAWAQDGEAGLRFDRGLHPSVLDHVAKLGAGRFVVVGSDQVAVPRPDRRLHLPANQ